MTQGKERYKNESDKRLFDTSVCHARFRRARVNPSRRRDFNNVRNLDFNSNRRIDARMKGVVFRQGYAVGFREVQIANLDDVMDKADWPDMGKAAPPERFEKGKVKGWDKRWGKTETFEERWNLPKKVPRSKEEAVEYVKSAARKEIAKRYQQYEPQIKPVVEKVQQAYERSPVEVRWKDGSQQSGAPRGPGSPKVVWEDSGEAEQAEIVKERPVISAASKKRAYALNEYALTLMEMSNYDLALKYFEKAIELDPTEDVYKTNKDRCNDWIRYKQQGGN